MAAPALTLSNGKKIPSIGLGTFEVEDKRRSIEDAVKDAIDAGYRLIDTASAYNTEGLVGNGVRAKIAEGVIKREDMFIVTKLWNNRHDYENVVPACKESLKCLGLDYIDLYLIHWPMGYPEHAKGVWPVDEKGNPLVSDVDYVETWKAMEECVNLGLVKSIGVSNFNAEQIDRILTMAKIKPVVNQVECHLKFNQKKLRAFCGENGILMMAFSPLGAPGYNRKTDRTDSKHVGDVPVVTAIAEKYGKTSAQVALKYLLEIGTIPIPKSISTERIRQNIDIFDFKLTPEEIASIDKLDCGSRLFEATPVKTHKFYPFHAEF